MEELQRYQKYATPTIFWNNPEQPLIEARTYIDYVPVKPVESTDTDQNKEEETTDSEPKSALSYIKTVKTFLLVGEDDKTCNKEQAELIGNLIPTVEQTKFFKNAGHDFFTWSN